MFFVSLLLLFFCDPQGWRLFARSSKAYPGIAENSAVEHFVETGGRLTLPSNTDRRLWAIVNACWAASPTDRPQFSGMSEAFAKIEKIRFVIRPPDVCCLAVLCIVGSHTAHVRVLAPLKTGQDRRRAGGHSRRSLLTTPPPPTPSTNTPSSPSTTRAPA